MGLWNKTLFYLGLVDEDAVESQVASQRPASRPARDTADPDYPGAPRREQEPARPIGGRRPPRAGTFSTGEPLEPDTAVEPRGVRGRRVEPPMTSRRRPSPTTTDQALADSGVVVSPVERDMVRTVGDADLESEVIVARSYSDAQTVADHLRASVPVVLDLRKVEPAMVRRLVDFASGLTYALGGSMRKIAQGVVLVTPANVNISRDERRRLRELGYHEDSEEF